MNSKNALPNAGSPKLLAHAKATVLAILRSDTSAFLPMIPFVHCCSPYLLLPTSIGASVVFMAPQ